MEANKVPDSPNGTYTLPPSYKVESGDTSDISQHNPPFEDVAQALSDRLHRDGRTSWTGNQNANGFKVTGLAPGTNPGDALSVGAVGPAIGSAAEKTAIVDGDHIAISDSEDSQKLKRVKWSSLKEALSALFNAKVTKAGDSGLGGFTSTVHDLGNSSGQDITLSNQTSNFKTLTRNGNCTLRPPTGTTYQSIAVYLSGSTGTVTMSGWTKVHGSFISGKNHVLVATIIGGAKVATIMEAN